MKISYPTHFLALLGLSVNFAFAAPVDFVSSGSLTVQAKFTTSLTGTTNLLSGTTDFVTYTLNDAGFIDDSFSVTPVDSLYFSLADDGFLMLDMIAGQSYAFTLSFLGLLPQDGLVLDGFNYDTGSDLGLDFSFANAASGEILISGNVAASSNIYIEGSFTASTVPEPTTAVFGLAAAIGLYAVWRRKRIAA